MSKDSSRRRSGYYLLLICLLLIASLVWPWFQSPRYRALVMEKLFQFGNLELKQWCLSKLLREAQNGQVSEADRLPATNVLFGLISQNQIDLNRYEETLVIGLERIKGTVCAQAFVATVAHRGDTDGELITWINDHFYPTTGLIELSKSDDKAIREEAWSSLNHRTRFASDEAKSLIDHATNTLNEYSRSGNSAKCPELAIFYALRLRHDQTEAVASKSKQKADLFFEAFEPEFARRCTDQNRSITALAQPIHCLSPESVFVNFHGIIDDNGARRLATWNSPNHITVSNAQFFALSDRAISPENWILSHPKIQTSLNSYWAPVLQLCLSQRQRQFFAYAQNKTESHSQIFINYCRLSCAIHSRNTDELILLTKSSALFGPATYQQTALLYTSHTDIAFQRQLLTTAKQSLEEGRISPGHALRIGVLLAAWPPQYQYRRLTKLKGLTLALEGRSGDANIRQAMFIQWLATEALERRSYFFDQAKNCGTDLSAMTTIPATHAKIGETTLQSLENASAQATKQQSEVNQFIVKALEDQFSAREPQRLEYMDLYRFNRDVIHSLTEQLTPSVRQKIKDFHLLPKQKHSESKPALKDPHRKESYDVLTASAHRRRRFFEAISLEATHDSTRLAELFLAKPASAIEYVQFIQSTSHSEQKKIRLLNALQPIPIASQPLLRPLSEMLTRCHAQQESLNLYDAMLNAVVAIDRTGTRSIPLLKSMARDKKRSYIHRAMAICSLRRYYELNRIQDDLKQLSDGLQGDLKTLAARSLERVRELRSERALP